MNAPVEAVSIEVQPARQGLHAELPLDEIRSSPTNPRKTFHEESISELAESIRQFGVLQPILVRPNPAEGGYELIAGERRWRAAMRAGIEKIPAIVRALDDLQVLEVQVIENLQREDLHPVEEADGFEKLVRNHGYSVEELAAKLGKSPTYVYSRMRLCSLCHEARVVFQAGDLSVSLALLVARIPHAEMQIEACKAITEDRAWQGGPMSLREARDYITRTFMLDLARACFDVKDASLPGGACTVCPKRTGSQSLLFSDMDERERCSDPICFKAKAAEHSARLKAAAIERGLTIIEGEKAKKVMPYEHSRPNGYVRLDDRCYEDGKQRPWRKVIGKNGPAPTLIENVHSGELVECITEAEASAVLKAKGFKEQPDPNVKWKEQQKKEQHERKVRKAIYAACREKVPGRQLDEADLRLIAAGFLDSLSFDRVKELAKAWEVDESDLAYTARHKFFDLVALEQLPAMLLDMALANHVSLPFNEERKKNDVLLATAARYGVDVKAIRARMAPKPPTKKAEADTKAQVKPTAAKKAPAKKAGAKKAPARKASARKAKATAAPVESAPEASAEGATLH